MGVVTRSAQNGRSLHRSALRRSFTGPAIRALRSILERRVTKMRTEAAIRIWRPVGAAREGMGVAHNL